MPLHECTGSKLQEITMKTTKLINGKTFDEVFAERGKETTIDKMVVGNIYLLEQDDFDWNWLTIFAGLNDVKEHPSSEIRTMHDLASDGDSLFINDTAGTKGLKRDDIAAVYEATPSQIELLNMYINHEN